MGKNNYYVLVDLAISLMIIFILLFIVVAKKVVDYKDINIDKTKYEEEIKELKEQLNYMEIKEQKLNEQLLKETKEQENIDDKEKLRNMLKQYDIDAKIQGNSIVFDLVEDKLNFKFDSSELKPKGKHFLSEFIPSNATMWCGSMKDKISAIQIVGYTDSVGDDNYNMKLSLERALSVMNYTIYKTKISNKYRDCLFNLITINGRGERVLLPLGSKPGTENKAKSRRVEFKIMLDPDKAIENNTSIVSSNN